MELKEEIFDFKSYESKFLKWEAEEIIIDDSKAWWCLKNPNSSVQKICMFRDGPVVNVYGNYGNFTFDKMTCLGDVCNLAYDDLDYQFGKLSEASKKYLYAFDDEECKKDVINWMKEHLSCDEYLDHEINEIAEYISNLDISCTNDWLIADFCERKNYDCGSLLYFVEECFKNVDNCETWIDFLKNSELGNFDDFYESILWEAGKKIRQDFFINLYALKICGEKLNEKNK
ncbi:hypothetical protein [Amedibacterium intestinale]|uniref:hypothetical protein n=1 Tax=Amedibacterium intestinale TaxID=2583452 RepID=UPI000E4D10CF|nr:hypothetical protein [Amedibacterium intestinale]RHO26825.1 hypothetical protein DW208_11100 [Erysipelotrichaceae bacterium AM17-60]